MAKIKRPRRNIKLELLYTFFGIAIGIALSGFEETDVGVMMILFGKLIAGQIYTLVGAAWHYRFYIFLIIALVLLYFIIRTIRDYRREDILDAVEEEKREEEERVKDKEELRNLIIESIKEGYASISAEAQDKLKKGESTEDEGEREP